MNVVGQLVCVCVCVLLSSPMNWLSKSKKLYHESRRRGCTRETGESCSTLTLGVCLVPEQKGREAHGVRDERQNAVGQSALYAFLSCDTHLR